MITETDVGFHTPPDADHHWAETNHFVFSVPDHHIVGLVYNCIRQGLGSATSEVILFDSLTRDRWDVLHFDSMAHLPAPEKLERYELANGMAVAAVGPPRDYRIDYQGPHGTELHLDVTGIMEPYDIHDPTMCPTAPPEAAERVAGSGFGAGYSGHFDLTARYTGTLTLAGRTYDIDCVDDMDHSWGPRTERGMRSMCWSGGHFGEDYGWHGLWAKDPFAPPEDEFRIAHGYVHEDGKVIGLVGGTMVARREHHIPVHVDIVLADRDGREHRMTGQALANHDWVPHACLNVHQVFYEYRADGRPPGYGVIEEAVPLDMMAAARSRS
jgi:hypothetical protein